MRPDDANIMGNVHGGIILKMIEEAGCIVSTRHCNTQDGVRNSSAFLRFVVLQISHISVCHWWSGLSFYNRQWNNLLTLQAASEGKSIFEAFWDVWLFLHVCPFAVWLSQDRCLALLVRVEKTEFLSPVFIGEVVHISAEITYTSKHSLEVQVIVMAENILTGDIFWDSYLHVS